MRTPIFAFLTLLMTFPLPTLATSSILSVPLNPIVLTQTATVRVVDAVQKPISGAVVTVYTDAAKTIIADNTAKIGSSDAVESSDAQGNTNFTLKVGTYYIGTTYTNSWGTHVAAPTSFEVTASTPISVSSALDTVGSNVLMHVYDASHGGQGVVGAMMSVYADASMGSVADDLAKPATQADAQGTTDANGDIGFLLTAGTYYYRMSRGSSVVTGTVTVAQRVATNVGIRLPDATPTPVGPCPLGEVNYGTTAQPLCRPPHDDSTPTATSTPCLPSLASGIASNPCGAPADPVMYDCPPGMTLIGTAVDPWCAKTESIVKIATQFDIQAESLHMTADEVPTFTIKNTGVIKLNQIDYALQWLDQDGNVLDVFTKHVKKALVPGASVTNVGAFGAGWNSFLKYRKDHPTAARSIRLVVDPAQALTETDETNNVQSLVVSSYGLRDVAISEASLLPADVLHFTVKNVGAFTAHRFTVTMRWMDADGKAVSDQQYVIHATGALKPGQQRSFPSALALGNVKNFLKNMPAGATSVLLRVTLDGPQETELNLSNNTKAVDRLRDLTASSVGFSEDEALTFAIKNTGAFVVDTFAYELQWLDVNGGLVGSFTGNVHTALAPGVTYTKPVSMNEKSWKAFVAKRTDAVTQVRLIVDPAHTITEINESNNVFETRIQAPGSRDIAVYDYALSEKNVPTFRVQNNTTFSIHGIQLTFEWLNADHRPMVSIGLNTGKMDYVYTKTIKPTAVVHFPIAGIQTAQFASFVQHRPAGAKMLRVRAALQSSAEHDVNPLDNDAEKTVIDTSMNLDIPDAPSPIPPSP